MAGNSLISILLAEEEEGGGRGRKAHLGQCSACPAVDLSSAMALLQTLQEM